MTRPFVPQSVLDAAHARSAARRAQDWERADLLRAEIEEAGWKIVDRGADFGLEPAGPADVVGSDGIRHGTSGSVPSRQLEPDAARATFAIVASDDPAAVDRTLAGILAHRGRDDQVLLIADGPSSAVEERLTALPPDVEVIRTATRLGAGAALAITLRRATGAVVILVDDSVVPMADVVPRIADALQDPGVAVVGFRGYRTADLREYVPVSTAGETTVIADGVLAFRRSDALAVAAVDEAFRGRRNLIAWWSLILREGWPREADGPAVIDGIEGQAHADDQQGGVTLARRAMVVDRLLVEASALRDAVAVDPEAAHQARREFYRLLRRFRGAPFLWNEPTAEHHEDEASRP